MLQPAPMSKIIHNGVVFQSTTWKSFKQGTLYQKKKEKQMVRKCFSKKKAKSWVTPALIFTYGKTYIMIVFHTKSTVSLYYFPISILF